MKWEDLDTEQVRALAAQVEDIHQETNIDGYGDEGAGYDYKLQVKLLLEAGWTPPAQDE
jgi:hypothetical protein